ncbi:MAG: hypothetical protein IM613_20785 [Cytophagales bacterium]|nr:hypothetical protein [Cytophagales bacterium]
MADMKKYLILKAFTGSDHEICSFALLPLPLKLKDPLGKLQLLVDNPDVATITVFGDFATFYSDLEELPDTVMNMLESAKDEEPLVVELPPQLVESLQVPSETIKQGEVAYGRETVTFSATGKDSRTEYWCTANRTKLLKIIIQTEILTSRNENKPAQTRPRGPYGS